MVEILSYRNQSIDLLCKSTDWFLYDQDLRHERVKPLSIFVKSFMYAFCVINTSLSLKDCSRNSLSTFTICYINKDFQFVILNLVPRLGNRYKKTDRCCRLKNTVPCNDIMQTK